MSNESEQAECKDGNCRVCLKCREIAARLDAIMTTAAIRAYESGQEK